MEWENRSQLLIRRKKTQKDERELRENGLNVGELGKKQKKSLKGILWGPGSGSRGCDSDSNLIVQLTRPSESTGRGRAVVTLVMRTPLGKKQKERSEAIKPHYQPPFVTGQKM